MFLVGSSLIPKSMHTDRSTCNTFAKCVLEHNEHTRTFSPQNMYRVHV